MSTGTKLPLTITPLGGIQKIEGPEMLQQNIRLGVTPASSRHPWNQHLAPKEDLIFDINDSLVGGQLVAHIYSFFDELERLGQATLSRKRDAVKLDLSDRGSGDMKVAITYTDLEDNISREVLFDKGRK